ncbi:hypothetical protein RYX41_08865 [Lactiplantibacillus plantarum]|nr:hypothetical protein [Lactiplantibacillus plantarum]MDV2576552.1 hypothetical protein [Lactiplantibacillus plantarum]
MATVKLRRLWWQQNRPWVRLVTATCLLVSLLMAINVTHTWQVEHARSVRGERINAADFVKHPKDYKVAGRPAVSLHVYYEHLDQFFGLANTLLRIPIRQCGPNNPTVCIMFWDSSAVCCLHSGVVAHTASSLWLV